MRVGEGLGFIRKGKTPGVGGRSRTEIGRDLQSVSSGFMLPDRQYSQTRNYRSKGWVFSRVSPGVCGRSGGPAGRPGASCPRRPLSRARKHRAWAIGLGTNTFAPRDSPGTAPCAGYRRLASGTRLESGIVLSRPESLGLSGGVGAPHLPVGSPRTVLPARPDRTAPEPDCEPGEAPRMGVPVGARLHSRYTSSPGAPRPAPRQTQHRPPVLRSRPAGIGEQSLPAGWPPSLCRTPGWRVLPTPTGTPGPINRKATFAVSTGCMAARCGAGQFPCTPAAARASAPKSHRPSRLTRTPVPSGASPALCRERIGLLLCLLNCGANERSVVFHICVM
jgi:hypothetical protein